MTKPKISIEDVREAQGKASMLRLQYLEERGWESTTATPGHFCVMTREWQGKTLLVDGLGAMEMQTEYFDKGGV